eukprot:304601-Amphidinium_carterae.1
MRLTANSGQAAAASIQKVIALQHMDARCGAFWKFVARVLAVAANQECLSNLSPLLEWYGSCVWEVPSRTDGGYGTRVQFGDHAEPFNVVGLSKPSEHLPKDTSAFTSSLD